MEVTRVPPGRPSRMTGGEPLDQNNLKLDKYMATNIRFCNSTPPCNSAFTTDWVAL